MQIPSTITLCSTWWGRGRDRSTVSSHVVTWWWGTRERARDSVAGTVCDLLLYSSEMNLLCLICGAAGACGGSSCGVGMQRNASSIRRWSSGIPRCDITGLLTAGPAAQLAYVWKCCHLQPLRPNRDDKSHGSPIRVNFRYLPACILSQKQSIVCESGIEGGVVLLYNSPCNPVVFAVTLCTVSFLLSEGQHLV